MTPERYFTRCAVDALSAGRPLHSALESAAAATPTLPPSVKDAFSASKAGDLPRALLALDAMGFDPLVADVAQLEPHCTGQAAQKLLELEGARRAWLPIYGALGYLAVVFAFESFAREKLSQCLPALDRTFADLQREALAPGLPMFLWPMLGAAICLGVGASLRLRIGPLWRLLNEPIENARIYATAAVLASSRIPSTAMSFVGKRLPEISPRLELEGSAIDPGGLDFEELADLHAGEARRRARQTLTVVKVLGAMTAVLIALSICASVYLRLAQLPGAMP